MAGHIGTRANERSTDQGEQQNAPGSDRAKFGGSESHMPYWGVLCTGSGLTTGSKKKSRSLPRIIRRDNLPKSTDSTLRYTMVVRGRPDPLH